MIIQSTEVPQADSINSIIQAIINIGNGARTDEEIISNIPNINSDRQGRYYRKVGELLGFVINIKNNARLTSEGEVFFSNPVLTNEHLKEAILRMKIFQVLIPFIEVKGSVTRIQVIDHLKSLGIRLAHSTLDRRASSLLSWLLTLGVVKQTNNKFLIASAVPPVSGILQLDSESQPILPIAGDLSEYQEIEQRISSAKQEVAYFKDQAKLERATNSHIALINLVSQRIRQNGGIPKSNQLIDLAVRLDQDYIFEMKSTNEENVRSQIRKGMSQLYEYRYLQNKPEAKLILVVEKPLGANHSWMLDYMETDRAINLVWDGNEELYGSERSRSELGFLGLQP